MISGGVRKHFSFRAILLCIAFAKIAYSQSLTLGPKERPSLKWRLEARVLL